MVKMRGTEAYISISIYWIVNTDMHRIFVLDQRSHHNADEGKKIEIKEETLVDIGIDIYNNEFNGSSINEKKENILTNGDPNLKKGDMAKLVDATDLIGLSLGMETY